jgi:hypothetical protein
MAEVGTIGLDTAKRVFQVHGVDTAGAIVFRRQLRRAEMVRSSPSCPPCLVGLEACATAHYRGRQIAALGHRVRLMPPTRVKRYVRWRRKNDQTGAQACCEAVSRPSMQFVPLKSVPEPVALMTHRARPLLVEQYTQLGNSIRAPMAERGIIARRGPAGFAALLAMIEHPEDRHLPAEVRPILAVLALQWRSLGRQIAALERQIIAWHKSNPDGLRLATLPRFGPICPAPWSPPRVSPSGLTAAGSSLPGSDWCRRRTRPAANSDAAASPKRAPAICASSWWSPLPASSPGCAPIPRSLPGSPGCSPGCRRARPPWRSPTRWPVAWARLAKQTTYRAPAAIETAHPA